jgi:hypothetical protein
MLPKTGKRLPRRGARRPDRQRFAIEIGKALRAELGNAWYSEDGHGAGPAPANGRSRTGSMAATGKEVSTSSR